MFLDGDHAMLLTVVTWSTHDEDILACTDGVDSPDYTKLVSMLSRTFGLGTDPLERQRDLPAPSAGPETIRQCP